METNAKPFSCGGCGCTLYFLYKVEDKIITECSECKSLSDIVIIKPKLSVQWGSSGDGLMCTD